jgi:hypothetical protein
MMRRIWSGSEVRGHGRTLARPQVGALEPVGPASKVLVSMRARVVLAMAGMANVSDNL